MDPPMKWWMVAAVVAMSVSVADAGESGQPPPIDLQMVNHARVPPEVMERALHEVTRIYADAGLTVRWIDTACLAEAAEQRRRAPRFTVHIVMHALGYGRAGSQVMGVALRRPGGSMAQVFLKQVQDFARIFRVDVSTLLAHVIAHEVGHLLLGTPHSPTGLMQAGWDKALLHDATTGALTFTAAQAERIRASR